MAVEVVTKTDFPFLKPPKRSKVRDVYQLPDNQLLIVATDRLSAFDVVLPTPIPGRGVVLTQLTLFWTEILAHDCLYQLVTADAKEIADLVQVSADERATFIDTISNRAMVVREAEVFPIEFIARGYLAGNAWKEYQTTGKVAGMRLPADMLESASFLKPLFTPTTKEPEGHDQPISYRDIVDVVGSEDATRLRDMTLGLYSDAAQFALSRGIIIADTKFEFGRTPNGEIVLVDEVLTPDSSRFWDAKFYQTGRSQPSFDKQIVRDYLVSQGWSSAPPDPPVLPIEVVYRTMKAYQEVRTRLTSQTGN